MDITKEQIGKKLNQAVTEKENLLLVFGRVEGKINTLKELLVQMDAEKPEKAP